MVSSLFARLEGLMRRGAVVLIVVGFAWSSCRTTGTKGAPSTPPAPSRPTRPSSSTHDEMVRVPAGSFLRGNGLPEGEGNPDERPQKSILLDAFSIDKQEVTVARYRKCVQAGACTVRHLTGQGWGKQVVENERCNWGKSGRDDHPVNCVDWNQAKTYCAWAGKRLPTEAEWEKAARGTDGREYPWGREEPTCQRAAIVSCGKEGTQPAGSTSPAGDSPYGAQDMAGNVKEWVSDWYAEDYYVSSPAKNPTGPPSGTDRVLRGGSMNYHPGSLRVALRFPNTPEYRGFDTGFRCVRTQ
jgi:eukaryotic-like serine/threonine-protein kinase